MFARWVEVARRSTLDIELTRSTVLRLVAPFGCNSSAYSPRKLTEKTHRENSPRILTGNSRLTFRRGWIVYSDSPLFWTAVSGEPKLVHGAFAHLQEEVQIRDYLSDVELQTSSTTSA
jgi:hypothetical protein